MKKTKKILVITLIILISLTGCSKKENENGELKEKVKQEINYMDNKIISMLNRLNNISLENYNIVSNEAELNEKSSQEGTSSSGEEKQSNQEESQEGAESKENKEVTTTKLKSATILSGDEQNIDWDGIQSEVETLNNSWDVILLDLYDLEIKNDEILGFSNKINSCIINIANKDKKLTLKDLAELYSYIPKYMNHTNSENEQKIKQSKYYLLNAYVLVNEDNWEEVKNNLEKCENEFNKLTNNTEFNENKEYKSNKVFILIKEIQNSISTKDKKVFFIKYKNLLQSINSV